MPAYPYSSPRPAITRAIDESPAVQLRAGGTMVERMHVSNPSATTVMYFKAWDVLLVNLNTGTSRMLYDHPIPAGQTLVIEDLPLDNGLTVKCTSVAGAADATAPETAGLVHDWKME